jgi:hypothetical protein
VALCALDYPRHQCPYRFPPAGVTRTNAARQSQDLPRVPPAEAASKRQALGHGQSQDASSGSRARDRRRPCAGGEPGKEGGRWRAGACVHEFCTGICKLVHELEIRSIGLYACTPPRACTCRHRYTGRGACPGSGSVVDERCLAASEHVH